MTVTIKIYESLKDYSKDLPVVELMGVTAADKSVVGGYVFYVGEDEQQHFFPKDIIFVVVENED